MKKGIKYLLFSCCILFCYLSNSKASSEFILENDPNTLTYKIEKDNKTVKLYLMLVKDKETNELLYCLEPGVNLSNELYEELSEWEYARVNLTKEQKDYITKVAYYGYEYQNHTSIYYYYAAQLLIWEKIIPENWKIYYTDYLGGNKVEWFQEERKEILELIAKEEKLPSFANQTISWNYKDTLILEDTNQVLKNFQVKKLSNFKYTQFENTLEITAENSSEAFIEFVKEHEGPELKFYLRNDGQNIMRKGKLSPKSFQLTLKPYEAKFELQKKNNNQNPIANVEFQLTAEEDIYSNGTRIYQKGESIKMLKTDEEGYIKEEGLHSGSYCLTEINAPIEYQIDPTPHCFTLNETNQKMVLTLENQKKRSHLKILKEDKDTHQTLANVRFQIFDDQGTLLVDTKTNEKGEIYLENLPFGTYKIIELETLEDYVLEKDPIYFNIDGEVEELTIVITNRKIENVPNTKEIIFYPPIFQMIKKERKKA